MRKNNKQIRRLPRAHSHTHTNVNFPVDFINVCRIVFHKHVYFTFLHSLLNMFAIISTLAGLFHRGKKTTTHFYSCVVYLLIWSIVTFEKFCFFAHWTHIHTYTWTWNSVIHRDGDTNTYKHTHSGAETGRERESKCEGDNDVESTPESRELYDIDRLFVCWVRTHYTMLWLISSGFYLLCRWRMRFDFQHCCCCRANWNIYHFSALKRNDFGGTTQTQNTETEQQQ